MANKWIEYIQKLTWIEKSIALLKSIKPWGFQGLSLWYVSSFFVEGITKGSLGTRAAAISFRLFLAFFPGIILLLSLIPHIPVEDFQANLFDSLRGFFPGDTFSLFESTLDDLINKKHNALLSIGFILVIYYASNSINAILLGFNESYHLDERGHPIIMRIASIILIFVLGFLMITAVILIIFSGSFFEYLHEHGIIGDKGYIPILNFAKWAISLFLIYAVISTLYNVGNGRRRRKWRFFNVGTTFATAFFILASIGFAYFVNNFAQFNKLYGSLGTLMVLLIWLNFNSMIILMGFDLNTSIVKAKRTMRKEAEALEVPDQEPEIPISEEVRNTFRHPQN
jgi:membrane protein